MVKGKTRVVYHGNSRLVAVSRGESVPGKRSGAWVFRGTRTPFSTACENLQDMSVDDRVVEFGVTREQVEAVLEFAAQSTEAPPVSL